MRVNTLQTFLVVCILLGVLFFVPILYSEYYMNLPKLEKIELKPEKIERIGNNCLFDAVRNTCETLRTRFTTSQALREACSTELKAEGFPIIPNGEPAGEQYLQAISKISQSPIEVVRGNTNTLISHSEDFMKSTPITIRHVGSTVGGHWMAV